MRLLLALAALPLVACNGFADIPAASTARADGQREWNVSGFDKVDASGSTDITIHTGQAFSVRGEGDPDLLDRMQLSVSGSQLHIGMKKGNWGISRGNAHLTITMPRITAVETKGSGDVEIDRAAGPFSGSIKGSGDLMIGEVQGGFTGAIKGSGNILVKRQSGGDVKLSIAGSGDIGIGGTADTLDISIAGSGDVDAGGLTTKSATIQVAGSGNVGARVNGPVTIGLRGSGNVDVKGQPRCTTSKAGSGSVRCG
ncbi:head GIN domain-containing protein [Stakelama pacifica]|uniref:Putative autotransporter adhesin-like protein n=1 Tax=Stakelama pacifica TaxID=517720 RepID=A0A4R6FUB0_9SPHN|nr:head GIN domain-containing protein [Stakelama pacifica]TDN85449.1 putative autotransporter adhesin-like protein [Stakelama pacifica]GGO92616.1 DUF2807 domain-containing protein [Stakelama pacifica]